MSNRFDIIPTPLPDLHVVRRKPIVDSRGYFERVYCSDELREAGLIKPIVQVNRTLTRRAGAVRGMHFQHPPYLVTKLVSCTHGRVLDVAVDLRGSSPTFLQWHGVELSDDNNLSLLVPDGFAHGFQTLTDNCELLYLHTAPFVPEAEGGVHGMDPRISIRWPLEVTEMSERDRSHPLLGEDYQGLPT